MVSAQRINQFLLAHLTACNKSMTSGFATFQSPNYPSSYPHSVSCLFNISLPVGNRIKLSIKDINLQQCNGCECDSLSIYNGSNPNAIKLATICNISDIGRQFVSSKNNLVLVFKSDGNITKHGFKANYTAIPPGKKFSWAFKMLAKALIFLWEISNKRSNTQIIKSWCCFEVKVNNDYIHKWCSMLIAWAPFLLLSMWILFKGWRSKQEQNLKRMDGGSNLLSFHV